MSAKKNSSPVFVVLMLLLCVVAGAFFVNLASANPVPNPQWPMILSNELAMMMVSMWPFVPMFLIQVHFATGFWRKLGLWTYLIVFVEWLPIAFVVYAFRETVLAYEVTVTVPFIVLGVVAVLAGVALHAWTAKLLGIKATMGYMELKPEPDKNKRRIIMSGPFGVVRHPSYWAHTLIILGIFLITGTVAVAILALVDFLIAYFVTAELEERELIGRFGEEYREYQARVPKFFPKLRGR
jgi:protein-S-isoprenylcysteine O-methyltransferase Ste14